MSNFNRLEMTNAGTLVYYQRHVTYLIATVVMISLLSIMKAHSKYQKGTCL